MWSSRLFWKLFLTAAGLNLIAAAVFATILTGWSEKQLRDEFDRRFHNAAVLLRDNLRPRIREGRTEELQATIRHLGRQTGMRITLVAMDGIVLADSEQADLAAVAEMENHKGRLELVQAAANGEGQSHRTSPTLQLPMRYYARRVDYEGAPVGLVRVALPTDSINAAISTARGRIWTAATVVSVVALFVAYWVVARIIRPLTTLTQAAEAMAQGDSEQRVYFTNRDEVGVLGDAFNRMSMELGTRIDELRDTGQRLATVLGGMVEGVIAVDRDQRVLFANSAAGNLLGFDDRVAVGRPLLETVRNHTLHEAVNQTIAGRASVRREIEIGDGNVRILGASFTQLPGEPCPGVVAVLNDFTELRRLESLRQEFVANVSHELKTPLAAIKAYAETLQRGGIDDTENRGRFVARIEEQAERLNQLILDLLNVARIESGNQVFEMVSVSLRPAVEESMENFQDAVRAKQITLAVEPDCEALQVRADADGLRHVLDNLIDNAVKYTPAGGRVTLGWHREGRMAVVDVTDTGIGISAEDVPRVFERFFRVDKARSREMGGTGLGLSIVKHLVLAFNGQVGVTSQPGQGSTFSVRLPLADDREHQDVE